MSWVIEPHDVYLKNPALSNSFIKGILNNSPMHAKFKDMNQEPPTPVMQMGTWVHQALLEPSLFRPTILPDPMTLGLKTKAGKPADNPTATSEWKDIVEQAKLRAGDNPVLTLAQYNAVASILESAMGNALVTELLCGGVAEQSGYSTINGVGVKIRPDYRRCGRDIIDLKITDDASANYFSRKARSFRYDIQAALYMRAAAQIEGVSVDKMDFVWIVIERDEPHGIAVYRPINDDIMRANADIDYAIGIFRECSTTGVWPGYGEKINALRLFSFGSGYGEDTDSSF